MCRYHKTPVHIHSFHRTALQAAYRGTALCAVQHLQLASAVPVVWLKQVSEKESGVRQVMSTMGLLNSAFWLTWSLFEGAMYSSSSALLSAKRTSN